MEGSIINIEAKILACMVPFAHVLMNRANNTVRENCTFIDHFNYRYINNDGHSRQLNDKWPQNYIDAIDLDSTKTIIISALPEILEELNLRGINYNVLIPKSEYLNREECYSQAFLNRCPDIELEFIKSEYVKFIRPLIYESDASIIKYIMDIRHSVHVTINDCNFPIKLS